MWQLYNIINIIRIKTKQIKELESDLKNLQLDLDKKSKIQHKKIKALETESSNYKEDKESMVKKLEDLKSSKSLKIKENEDLETEIENNKSNLNNCKRFIIK